MESVAAAGPGLVAVGSDSSGGDPDGAVWTSADGLSWIRVPPDEAVFGGPGWEEMYGVAAAGLGVIAVGYADGQGIYAETNAAVWVGSPSG